MNHQFYLGNIKVPVSKCKRPSFKDVRGRTWDSTTLLFNGEKVDVWLDTTWGEYIYFQYDNSWRKVRMVSTLQQDFMGKGYNIDPFCYPKQNLKVISK